MLLDRFKQIYGDDLIIHGSYARALILEAPTEVIRDIDLIIMDTHDNFKYMLEEFGVEKHEYGFDMNCGMFIRHTFEHEGNVYDVCVQRVLGFSKEKIRDYLNSMPYMRNTVVIEGDTPSHTKEEVIKLMDIPNPNFCYKWFSKDKFDKWVEKYGELPEPYGDDDLTLGGHSEDTLYCITIYQYLIPKDLGNNPYNIRQADIWESPYLDAVI